MKQVIDGYEITTASKEAAEQTKRGIESFIEWRMDPFDWLDRALETDPDCVFASLVKGLLQQTFDQGGKDTIRIGFQCTVQPIKGIHPPFNEGLDATFGLFSRG